MLREDYPEYLRIIELDDTELVMQRFYDAPCPPDYIPPEIRAVDTEFERFAAHIARKHYTVFSYTDDHFKTVLIQYSVSRARAILAHRRGLCEKWNNANDTIQLAFPPEIVSRIFMWAVAPYRGDDIIQNTIPTLRDVLAIASVSRAWRVLALATPRLWNALRLTHPRRRCIRLEEDSSEEEDYYNAMLEEIKEDHYYDMLSRSQAVDLDLQVEVCCSRCSTPILSALHREAHRIRSLHICVWRLLAVEPFHVNVVFPKLDVLVIHSDTTPVLLQTPPVSQLGRFIQPDSWPPISTLTRVDVDDMSPCALRRLLQTASVLEVLSIRRCQNWGSVFDGPLADDILLHDMDTGVLTLISGDNTTTVEPVVHTALQRLDIDDTDVLWTVKLPGLRSLGVGQGYGQHYVVPSFVERSMCALDRYGVGNLRSLLFLADAPDTIREVYMDEECLFLEAIFETANAYDDEDASVLHTALERIKTLTVRVGYERCPCHRVSPTIERLLPSLVRFHMKYGGRLERFDIHTARVVSIPVSPEYAVPSVLRLNGRRLEDYFTAPPLMDTGDVKLCGWAHGVTLHDWLGRAALYDRSDHAVLFFDRWCRFACKVLGRTVEIVSRPWQRGQDDGWFNPQDAQ